MVTVCNQIYHNDQDTMEMKQDSEPQKEEKS